MHQVSCCPLPCPRSEALIFPNLDPRAARSSRPAAPGRGQGDPRRLHDPLQRRLDGRQRPPLPDRGPSLHCNHHITRGLGHINLALPKSAIQKNLHIEVRHQNFISILHRKIFNLFQRVLDTFHRIRIFYFRACNENRPFLFPVKFTKLCLFVFIISAIKFIRDTYTVSRWFFWGKFSVVLHILFHFSCVFCQFIVTGKFQFSTR